MGLTSEDLAYMRAVQEEHQPLTLNWVRREPAPDGQGGRTMIPRVLERVTGRLDASPERVPDYLQDLATQGVLGLVSIPAGKDLRKDDVLQVVRASGDVDPDRQWQVVSGAWSDQWTTAVLAYVVPWREEGARG